MRKTSFKLLSASLAVAMTMSSMPYNVLAASPEQTFAQAVQQAQTTEADGFETAAPAEENLVTADAESTEKVTYTVTPGVSYGKGSIKLISGVTESTVWRMAVFLPKAPVMMVKKYTRLKKTAQLHLKLYRRTAGH